MRRWLHDWNKLNPILADGEVGHIIGMLITKTGDGKTPWQELSYTSTPDNRLPFGSRPLTEGLALVVYGTSFVKAVAGQSTTGLDYPSRLLSRGVFASVSNRGVAGDLGYRTLSRMLNGQDGSTAYTPAATNRGVVILDSMINDVRLHGASTRGVASWKNSIRGAIARAQAGTLQEQTSATTSGVWTNNPDAMSSGGTTIYTEDLGAYSDFTFTGPEVTVFTSKLRENIAAVMGAYEIREGANVLASGTTGGTDAPPAATPQVNAPHPVRITGLSDSSHTLRFITTAAGFTYFDSWVTPSLTPPSVVLVIDPPLNVWNTNSPYNNGTDAALDLYATAATEVAAEFSPGQVVVADSRPGWDKATMIGSDQVHPNDKGTYHLASCIEEALGGLTWRSGLHTL